MILWNQVYTTKLWRKALGLGALALTLSACNEAPVVEPEGASETEVSAVIEDGGATAEKAGVVKDTSFPEFDRSQRAERIAALGFDRDLGAKAFQVCADCHGLDGLGSRDGAIPRLAGQHRAVILHRLIEISDGVRIREEMMAYKPALATDSQIGALASYIESLSDPIEVRHGPGDELEAAERQYADLCVSCHGVSGQGDGAGGIPRIGGWDYGSVQKTLMRLKAPDAEIHETGMSDLVSMLRDDEVSALADYVSRLAVGTGN